MKVGQLAYIAAYINAAVQWRFSWYWQTTADRLRRIPVPEVAREVPFDVKSILPDGNEPNQIVTVGTMRPFALGDIYELLPGDYHNASTLRKGPIPLVSCGDIDNGIISYIAENPHVYESRLTIALNGSPLTAKFHPYRFSAKDDVAICMPKVALNPAAEVFIQAMLNRERWRYSYYRKCYVDKLRRFQVYMPANNGSINVEAAAKAVQATRYWKFVASFLRTSR